MKSPSDFPLLDFRFSLHIVYPYALMVTTHGGVITQYLLQMLPAVTTQVILHVVGVFAMRILHDAFWIVLPAVRKPTRM